MLHLATKVRLLAWIAIPLGCVGLGCGDQHAQPTDRLQLWHTFGKAETVALNETLQSAPIDALAVEPTVIPFAQGQMVLMRNLGPNSETCPDLVRIDATWLPALRLQDAIEPVPTPLGPGYTTAARDLVEIDGVALGVPQTQGGLALLYRNDKIARSGLALPPRTLGEIMAAAKRATGGGNPGLGIRPDGYWFVPFLRAAGSAPPQPQAPDNFAELDHGNLVTALNQFAAVFSTAHGEAPTASLTLSVEATLARFRRGELTFLIEGPWAIPDIGGANSPEFGVTALPGAPRGGQIFVVPRCAKRKDAAWQLANALTAPAVQLEWAIATGAIPTTSAALDQAPPLVKAFAQALADAEPLPRHPISAELFDDLSPAIVAVTSGNATTVEAADGLARSWTRLLRRHGATLVRTNTESESETEAP